MSEKRRRASTFVTVCLTALILACGSVILACGSVPETHYYVLTPAGEAMGAAGSAEGVRLGVESLIVDPPYDQDRLVYRLGRQSTEVGFYEQHRWAAAPGRLVATALAAGLRGTPGLTSVEPTRLGGDYDLLLAGRVVALEEIDLPGRQVARVELDLRLVEPEGEVLFEDRLSAEVDGQAANVGGILEQMRRAVEQVIEELRSTLAASLGASQADGRD